MPFDPSDEQDIVRLTDSIEWSLRRMKERRRQRAEHLQLLVGHHYGEDGSRDKRPINMIELGVQIFQRGVASHSPQVMVSSNYPDLQPYASDFELALNQQVGRINLKESFNTCAIEALFCLGVMEVGITSSDDPPDSEGYLYDPGQLFADPVLFDDLVLDMNAKTWDQQSYIGHDFVVPYEWVKDNNNYDPVVRAKITAPDRDTGDPSEHYRETGIRSMEFEDTLRLRQVYLPRQKKLLVFAVDAAPNEPLQVIDWAGPERGPYIPLSYGKVPGRLIPLAPVPIWYDLDDVINRCFNKAADQALRQRTVGVAQDPGLGELMRDAEDGDMLHNATGTDVQEVKLGGADQQTLAMVMWSKQMLSYMGGNWDVLAGLASQTRTVGQDELLAAGASGRMKDMQQTTIDFQTAVLKDMAYWLWHDPISEYHLLKPVGDTGYTVPAVFSPETREGRFTDYAFNLNPYSLQNMSPSDEANRLLMLITQFVLPAYPMMMQQGVGIGWEALFKTLGHKMNMPELKQIITYAGGQMMPERDGPPMPSNTSRTYNRTNTPAASQQGNEQTMMNMLLGGADSVQPAQMAALARPAG